MLHTKFHQNQPSGLERRILSVLPYMGMAAIFSCEQHYVNEFSFPCPSKLKFKIWLKMAQWLLIKQVQVSCVNDLGPWPSILTYLH